MGAPAGPSLVTVAFTLGWHVAELYAGALGAKKLEPSDPPEHLPGLSELEGYDEVELSVTQIGAGLQLLGSPCAAMGIQLPELPQSLSTRDPQHRTALKLELLEFHTDLLEKLTGADVRLGKAYGLGRALADTVLLPTPSQPQNFSDSFSAGRVGTLSQWLDDLETAFPPYAASATRSSLQAWSTWVATPTINGAPVVIAEGGGDLTRALHTQGRLWRSLLSEEKHGVDLLSVDDYVAAAVGLVRRTSRIAASFLRAWWWIAVLVLLVAAAIAWLVFAQLSGASKTATAIITFLGLLGVTWKGVGASLGKVLARAEPPLWDAEVKAAVCRAATQLPGEWPQGGAPKQARKTGQAPQDATQRTQHPVHHGRT